MSMARKKNYLICKFETEQDFQKHFKSIYDPAYQDGFDDGMAQALTYFYYIIDKCFTPRQKAIARDASVRYAIEEHNKSLEKIKKEE